MCKGAGGIFGCIFGGLMTTYYHPKWCFFWYSFMGLIVVIFACFLTKAVEENNVNDGQDEEVSDGNLSTSQEAYESQYVRQNGPGPVP